MKIFIQVIMEVVSLNNADNQHWGTRNIELKGEIRIKTMHIYRWGKKVPKTTEPVIIAIFQTLQNTAQKKIT